ncbi:hypothetical protein ACR6HW_08105 [Fusibacter sp. JL298sf-3]
MNVKSAVCFGVLVTKGGRNEKIKWYQLDSGCVQLQIHRDRCLERAVRLLFKTPTTMKIDLDEYGSFIWCPLQATSKALKNIGFNFPQCAIFHP